MSALPSVAAKIISLPSTRHIRYRRLQISLANAKRHLAAFAFAVAGAKNEILSASSTLKRQQILVKYISTWTKEISKLERKCAKLIAGMEHLEESGVLL